MAAVGAYPGTFNPPTVAHLAIAEAARQPGPARPARPGRLPPAPGKRPGPTAARAPAGGSRGHRRHPPLARGARHRSTTHRRRGRRATTPWCSAPTSGCRSTTRPGTPAPPPPETQTLARLPRLLLVPRPPHTLPEPLPPGAAGARCRPRPPARLLDRGAGRPPRLDGARGRRGRVVAARHSAEAGRLASPPMPTGLHRTAPAGEHAVRRRRMPGGRSAARHLRPGDPKSRSDLRPGHGGAAGQRARPRRALGVYHRVH